MKSPVKIYTDIFCCFTKSILKRVENRNFEHTTYTAESALDNYVLARVKANRLILDKKNYDEMVSAAGKDIAKVAEKEIDNLLKNFK